MGLNRSGEIAEAIRNIESDKALNIFPAAIQNEIFVKSKLRGKYQKDPIPTKENVWLPVIRSSCPSSFGNLFNLERLGSVGVYQGLGDCARVKNFYFVTAA